jgi:hypothetical protein
VLQKDVNEPIEDGESEMKKAARGNVTCKSWMKNIIRLFESF